VTPGVCCFLLVWEDMVGTRGLKYWRSTRGAPRIFEFKQAVGQQQIFLVSRCAYLLSLQLLLIEVHKPLLTRQPAYSNHPEVNFGTVRVAGVIQNVQEILAVSKVAGKQMDASQSIAHEFHRPHKPTGRLDGS
jgi:hypothetical protein